MVRLPCRSLALGLLLPSLAGCGGSSANEDNFRTLTRFIACEGQFEGTIDALGIVSEITGGLEAGDREDQPFPGPVRACLSFDHALIPLHAVVTVARIRMDLAFVAGAPFTDLGTLIVDHVNYGLTFPQPTAYSGQMVLGNIATLASEPSLGTKTANVLLAINNDRAATRTRSQFRLRWSGAERNFDGLDTLVRFVDAESNGGLGQTPLLEVTFQIPE